MIKQMAPSHSAPVAVNRLVRCTFCSFILLSIFGGTKILLCAPPQAGPGGAKQLQERAAPGQETPTARFKVDVNLTVVYATVTNPNGWVDRSLTREDFELKENGQKQEIAFFSRESELPLRVALLVDSSLSTARDLKFESEAAIRFFRSVLRPQDGGSVFEFSYDVHQLTNYTNDIEALSRGIRAISPETATSLFDAIYLASDTLKSRKQKKVMVIVSDGADTTSKISYAQALRAANEAEAIIFSVIIMPVKSDAGRALGGEHALMTLSEETGGMSFFPNTITELDSIYSKISEELRTQYTLGFYSTVNAPSTQLRRITLTTRNPRLTVRTRRGYFSKPGS
ncbi:MAG: VWA domain-containing protein [Acidobacteriia bacterium]|nr:VWA domain-containing protein [Terriglobia bacterium]